MRFECLVTGMRDDNTRFTKLSNIYATSHLDAMKKVMSMYKDDWIHRVDISIGGDDYILAKED